MKFYKYQSNGNDFIIIRYNKAYISKDYICFISDRHYGIGCDGVIYVTDDYHMYYYNSDGSKASMCGNGLRCVAQYYKDYYNIKDTITINSEDGLKTIYFYPHMIEINMGKYTLYKDYHNFYYVYIGVKHIIVYNQSLYHRLIPLLSKDYNINYVSIINRNHIKIETYERGAGPTLSCSTGACACALVSYKNDMSDNKLYVEMKGGSVYIIIDDDIYIRGKAYKVYEGEIKNPYD